MKVHTLQTYQTKGWPLEAEAKSSQNCLNQLSSIQQLVEEFGAFYGRSQCIYDIFVKSRSFNRPRGQNQNI